MKKILFFLLLFVNLHVFIMHRRSTCTQRVNLKNLISIVLIAEESSTKRMSVAFSNLLVLKIQSTTQK